MLNIAALALLISSLAAAGVWSPPPAPPDNPHLIREGHRLIVIEYERHIPSQTPPQTTTHTFIEEAKDKFQQASSHLPNFGQGIATPESADVEKPTHSSKDLICDSYGSCKEKISSAFHKAKDKISQKASDVEESAKDAVDKGEEKVLEIEESAKDAVKSKMEMAKEKAIEIEESAKDAVKSKMEMAKEKSSEIKESAKDAVKSKMESAKDAIKSTVESTKDAVKSAANVAREAEEDITGNISRVAGQAVERAEEAVDLLHRNLTDMLNRAKHAAVNAAKYVSARETERAVAEIVHLLAFAMAYGTCVWVTFVSSHVLATALPRQQFGMVQSKLYPVYFRAVAYGLGVACLGHFFAKERVVGVERVQGYNLLVALGLVLVNMFYLEPKATKVMFEMMKMEKEEGRGQDMADVLGEPVMTASTATTTTATTTTQSATTIGVTRTRTTVAVDQEAVKSRAAKLNKKLKKLNTHSSFVNIITLMSMTWHLVHLARRLQMTC